MCTFLCHTAETDLLCLVSIINGDVRAFNTPHILHMQARIQEFSSGGSIIRKNFDKQKKVHNLDGRGLTIFMPRPERSAGGI